MTQKELLYIEDAIKHEDNVIKIIDLSINTLENKELIKFMKEQKKSHNSMKKKLLEILEVKENE